VCVCVCVCVCVRVCVEKGLHTMNLAQSTMYVCVSICVLVCVCVEGRYVLTCVCMCEKEPSYGVATVSRID